MKPTPSRNNSSVRMLPALNRVVGRLAGLEIAPHFILRTDGTTVRLFQNIYLIFRRHIESGIRPKAQTLALFHHSKNYKENFIVNVAAFI